MSFEFDLSSIVQLGDQPLWFILWTIFRNGGWIFFAGIILWYLKEVWIEHIHHDYEHHNSWVLLELSIPKMNEQSPKAVEQLFSHLHGTLSGGNFVDKYWKGKMQDRFSFEIISIGGYIRFLIRTIVPFRDLVEAALYAQYPDAEITEVNDYTDDIPHHFPNPEWNLWGTEFIFAKPDAYPIRTYIHFEHQLSQELKDPIAALLETLSRLQEGEQVWLQLVIAPEGDHWQEHAQHVVDKMSGAPEHHSTSIVEKIFGPVHFLIKTMGEMLGFGGEHEESHGGGEEPPSLIQYMTPGERVVLEGVQMKMAKLAYRVKFRLMYLARHEVFSKARGVAPVIGAFKQFNTSDMNSLKPAKSVTTQVDYFFKRTRIASRQNKLMHAYIERDNETGQGEGVIMNTEELATLYHFPIITVKAPLVQKAESKRAEPPFTLPTVKPNWSSTVASRKVDHSLEESSHKKGGHDMPSNLPIV